MQQNRLFLHKNSLFFDLHQANSAIEKESIHSPFAGIHAAIVTLSKVIL
jgi:hypothetical protein